MEKRRQTGSGRDYSGVFLVLILIGIVVVVLGLMMAAAYSTARPRTTPMRFERSITCRHPVAPHRIYHSSRPVYCAAMEPYCPDHV